MGLSKKQKKYLKKAINKKSFSEIADKLGIPSKEIEGYVRKRWGEEKYRQFFNKASYEDNHDWQQKVISFKFFPWLKGNLLIILFLGLMVFIVYVNSLGNEFVSDDVGGILKNKLIYDQTYITFNLPNIIQPLTFFILNKIVGLTPLYFRLVNIFFHLGTVMLLYLIASLLLNPLIGFLAGILMAIHPLNTEAVTWISGGGYPKYTFFILLSLFYFILTKKNKNYLWLGYLSFILALLTSEKAMVFPLILLVFIFCFSSWKKEWTKLIFPGLLTIFWFLLYAFRIPARMTDTQAGTIAQASSLNPLLQIPVAVSTYLELLTLPIKLTLYHSEMTFNIAQFLLKLVIFITFLVIAVYSFFKKRQVFFWLSLFIISLLPTLTPFGISWIVAERYAYLGSIGIFIVIAAAIEKLSRIKDFKIPTYIIFSFIIIAFSMRTIIRNIDWKNEDNLWLAAAKTSPSSSQNHNNLGDYYGRHGNFDKAIAEFKKAIELRPGYADALHNLGNVYNQKGEVELAIENYQNALKYNPNLWQSYQNLAAIYYKEGDMKQTISNLEKAVQINPQDQNLQQLLLQLKSQ